MALCVDPSSYIFAFLHYAFFSMRESDRDREKQSASTESSSYDPPLRQGGCGRYVYREAQRHKPRTFLYGSSCITTVPVWLPALRYILTAFSDAKFLYLEDFE